MDTQQSETYRESVHREARRRDNHKHKGVQPEGVAHRFNPHRSLCPAHSLCSLVVSTHGKTWEMPLHHTMHAPSWTPWKCKTSLHLFSMARSLIPYLYLYLSACYCLSLCLWVFVLLSLCMPLSASRCFWDDRPVLLQSCPSSCACLSHFSDSPLSSRTHCDRPVSDCSC